MAILATDHHLTSRKSNKEKAENQKGRDGLSIFTPCFSLLPFYFSLYTLHPYEYSPLFGSGLSGLGNV